MRLTPQHAPPRAFAPCGVSRTSSIAWGRVCSAPAVLEAARSWRPAAMQRRPPARTTAAGAERVDLGGDGLAVVRKVAGRGEVHDDGVQLGATGDHDRRRDAGHGVHHVPFFCFCVLVCLGESLVVQIQTLTIITQPHNKHKKNTKKKLTCARRRG